MKVAILIMSAGKEPSTRNIEAMKDTFIKYSNEGTFNNTYDFYEYFYDSSLQSEEIQVNQSTEYPNYYIIHVGGTETVYRTYEKTYLVYKYLMNNTEYIYDRFVRINISVYLNMNLLDAIIEKTEEDDIYANVLNTYIVSDPKYINQIYPRGDFYIVSSKTIQGILETGKDLMYIDTADKNRIPIDHVDDTLFGIAYINYMGARYFEHLHLIYYNFIPYPAESIISLSTDTNDTTVYTINDMAVCTRIKTIPPGIKYSGYSWDDNTYRKYDPIKIRTVHSLLKDKKYIINSINELFPKYEEERLTAVMNLIGMRPTDIKNKLSASIPQ